MASMSNLIARGNLYVRESATGPSSNTTMTLLIVLLVLILISISLVGALYTVRKIRRSKAIARQQLPMYNDSRSSTHNPRRLTISTSKGSSIYMYDEKSPLTDGSASPPLSPESVPEIRITFPDEHDESTGRRKSGRVLVVRVGETSVGLEPLQDDDQLPAYEKETGGRFDSIDMERIGGLKEKSEWS